MSSSAAHHPLFRDVLWDFIRADAAEDTLRLRVCGTNEELLEQDEIDEGLQWTVPRGLVPARTEQRRIEPLSLSIAQGAGQKLWMSLPDVARHRVEAPGALPVRLRISGDVKEVRYLPWECMPLPPGAVVCRSIPVASPLPPVVVRQPPVRALYVVTNPKDERLLQADTELEAIRMTSPSYTHQVVSEPTLAGLGRALKAVQPHIVHYVGHSATSGGQGYLILHDNDQNTHWISAREFAAVLPSTVRLVCLSTCFTAENYDIRGLALFAQATGDASLPSVVGNRLPLTGSSQQTVRLFWQTFYTELLNAQGDTTSAFARAREAIRGTDEWAAFSFVVRDGLGWGLALSPAAPLGAAPALEEAPSASSKMKEFDALYTTSIANYLARQTSIAPPAAREVLRAHSRVEAERAREALSSLDFDWPGKGEI